MPKDATVIGDDAVDQGGDDPPLAPCGTRPVTRPWRLLGAGLKGREVEQAVTHIAFGVSADVLSSVVASRTLRAA
jgi:hypothetical protein